jgi:hypothetical protein
LLAAQQAIEDQRKKKLHQRISQLLSQRLAVVE